MLKKPYNLEKQKFGLNNHLTWDNIRTTNIDWWKKVGKSDPKEKVKENKKIKNQLADSISIKEALQNANNKIEN